MSLTFLFYHLESTIPKSKTSKTYRHPQRLSASISDITFSRTNAIALKPKCISDSCLWSSILQVYFRSRRKQSWYLALTNTLVLFSLEKWLRNQCSSLPWEESHSSLPPIIFSNPLLVFHVLGSFLWVPSSDVLAFPNAFVPCSCGRSDISWQIDVHLQSKTSNCVSAVTCSEWTSCFYSIGQAWYLWGTHWENDGALNPCFS